MYIHLALQFLLHSMMWISVEEFAQLFWNTTSDVLRSVKCLKFLNTDI